LRDRRRTFDGVRTFKYEAAGIESTPCPIAIDCEALDDDPVVDEVFLGREGDCRSVLSECVAQRALRTKEDALSWWCGDGFAAQWQIQRRGEKLERRRGWLVDRCGDVFKIL
jgi:hypothetical protein